MNHSTMHDSGHNAVIKVVHLQSDALEETDGVKVLNDKPRPGTGQLPNPSTHHGLVGVLLKLDEADPGDVLQVHVSVGAVWGVSVQIRGSGRGGHPQRLVAVDLVGHHIVGLQQSLEHAGTIINAQCAFMASEPEGIISVITLSQFT